MTNQEDQKPQQQPLPTQNTSHFMLSMGPNEFLLAVGHSRVAVQPSSINGEPTANVIQEWLMTLSMSPSSAKTLAIALASGVEQYEQLFGKIPLDPRNSLSGPQKTGPASG